MAAAAGSVEVAQRVCVVFAVVCSWCIPSGGCVDSFAATVFVFELFAFRFFTCSPRTELSSPSSFFASYSFFPSICPSIYQSRISFFLVCTTHTQAPIMRTVSSSHTPRRSQRPKPSRARVCTRSTACRNTGCAWRANST